MHMHSKHRMLFAWKLIMPLQHYRLKWAEAVIFS